MADWQTVSGVRFKCLSGGDLDESEIDKTETDLGDHYLFGEGEDKEDYDFPVVGADGCLHGPNVLSAWQYRRYAPVSESEMRDLLEPLNQQFDDPPIDFGGDDETESMLEKGAGILKADSNRQVVVGAVMVPDAIDAVGDFERAETIRELSEEYMENLATGDSENGVMHTKFSDGDITHVENRVLERSQTIGGETYPAGSWIVGKKVHNDKLWKLIESGSIGGFSIGGHIHESERYAPNEVPADVSGEFDDDVREVTKASIHEISLVDQPAVPSATIQVAKSDHELKADPRLTAGVSEATSYLVERGHDEDNAQQLAEYLNGETKAIPNDDGSWIERAKSFFSRSDEDISEKVGSTLSRSNRDSLMEIHDAAVTVLQDAGESYGRRAYADDRRVDFDGEKARSGDGLAESSEREITENMSEHMDREDYDEIAKRVASMTGDGGGGESEEKDDEETDLGEAVKNLSENQSTIVEQLEEMANAQGVSQQKSRKPSSDDSDELWGKSSPFAPASGDL